ncbi:MAG: thiol:disulfide interchange protein DsbA/DsbL [Sulfuritalea sp.]|jgi:thiol:disulfide interchange protein DsbA|nr:thiol:disulfide interchange protein DsbA/DsbL [Sulfuritalea sp.]
MRAWRGFLATVLATIGLCLALGAGAAELKEGRDFREISPPLAPDKTRIEVTEFFWYGCPHCFDFEPVLAAWVKNLPADVSFRRVPTIFPNNKWAPGARLYYTLEAMNLLEKLHSEVFKAIHVERQRLDNEKILFEWVAKKGVDPKRFSETWSSFGVQSRVQQAKELSQAAGLEGVPAVMVHGKYLALTPGTYQELVANIDQLVARVRAESVKK